MGRRKTTHRASGSARPTRSKMLTTPSVARLRLKLVDSAARSLIMRYSNAARDAPTAVARQEYGSPCEPNSARNKENADACVKTDVTPRKKYSKRSRATVRRSSGCTFTNAANLEFWDILSFVEMLTSGG